VPNKVTAESVRRALDGGPLPPENLLTLGRICMGMVARFQPREDNPLANMAEMREWTRLAIDANKAAGPYFAYRLAAIKHIHQHADLGRLSDEELRRLEQIAERAVESARDQGRDRPTLN